MIITHIVDDFLFELFPEAEHDTEKLTSILKQYYTLGPFEPEVELKDSTIEVSIDVDRINADKGKFDKLVKYAEAGKLDKAIELADELIENAPNISEYHRVRGQAYLEKGDHEEALNSLIDSLRWNPENESSLILLGNIYAKFKEDTETALTFYEKVLQINPEDYLSLNNIGAQLYQAGKKEEAKDYFRKAHELKPDYPNTLYALAMVYDDEGERQKAFDFGIKSLKENPNNDALKEQSQQFILKIAKDLVSDIDVDTIIKSHVDELTVKTDTDIKIVEDSSINTQAKIEYAEVYGRDYHLVKYKSDSPTVGHLIIHELTHLELAHEAREKNNQKLFTSNESTKSIFVMNFKEDAEKLKKSGYPEEKVNNLMQMFYDGLNNQIYNAPIDLFIENRIYQRFPELRPLQLLSMHSILKEGIQANTHPDILKITPNKVLSSSVTYNLVNALQFKELFGIDLIKEFKPNKKEINRAENFYNEYVENKENKEAGQEYDIVQFWAEDLDLHRYFELVDEEERKRNTADSVLDDIEKDPFGLEEEDPSKERKMEQFIESHGGDDTNMAVAMYMVGALQYFENMDKAKIKEIAFDIAKVGTAGIDPNKDGYRIPSIPGSNFSGYKTLAYFYVSWALAVPEMVASLGLPFDNEFELAKKYQSMTD